MKTSNSLELSQDNICLFLGALLNYSDLHDEFCLECNEVGMVQLFVEMSQELQDSIPHNVKYVVSTVTVVKYNVNVGIILSNPH